MIYDFRLGSRVRMGKPSTSSSVVAFGRDEGAEEHASKIGMDRLESVSAHWMTSDELMGQSVSTSDLSDRSSAPFALSRAMVVEQSRRVK